MEYGLIGEKLGHSASKEIHEQLADYSYELHPLTKEDFPIFMEEKAFRALNVTIPYKQAVIPYLTAMDENAKAIGAVNSIVNRNGSLYGYAGISLYGKEKWYRHGREKSCCPWKWWCLSGNSGRCQKNESRQNDCGRQPNHQRGSSYLRTVFRPPQ